MLLALVEGGAVVDAGLREGGEDGRSAVDRTMAPRAGSTHPFALGTVALVEGARVIVRRLVILPPQVPDSGRS